MLLGITCGMIMINESKQKRGGGGGGGVELT